MKKYHIYLKVNQSIYEIGNNITVLNKIIDKVTKLNDEKQLEVLHLEYNVGQGNEAENLLVTFFDQYKFASQMLTAFLIQSYYNDPKHGFSVLAKLYHDLITKNKDDLILLRENTPIYKLNLNNLNKINQASSMISEDELIHFYLKNYKSHQYMFENDDYEMQALTEEEYQDYLTHYANNICYQSLLSLIDC